MEQIAVPGSMLPILADSRVATWVDSHWKVLKCSESSCLTGLLGALGLISSPLGASKSPSKHCLVGSFWLQALLHDSAPLPRA